MAQTSKYLFVYGTLLSKENEFGKYLNRNCSFYNDGKFKGRLYDVGEYPGAVLNADGLNYVYGKVYRLNNADEVLERLDDYEGFGPEQDQPNLFTRELINIETRNALMVCWVYLYNLPVNGFRWIESGKYLS
ncbi:MAG: gamma-glutamylcyclotransferase [Bacteroidota bacterium]|nr:gamma-glutamylcyclotransferase [Bacteroidota bacterium]